MLIEIKDVDTFIPEWNNNKDLPQDQQIVFTYKTPNIATRKRILQKPTVTFNYDRDGVPTGGSGEIVSDPEAAVRAVETVTITNLEYKKGGKTVSIRDALDLCAAPSQFYGLIKEFSDHLTEKAREEVPEKN